MLTKIDACVSFIIKVQPSFNLEPTQLMEASSKNLSKKIGPFHIGEMS
jgi:hypothetical protein